MQTLNLGNQFSASHLPSVHPNFTFPGDYRNPYRLPAVMGKEFKQNFVVHERNLVECQSRTRLYENLIMVLDRYLALAHFGRTASVVQSDH